MDHDRDPKTPDAPPGKKAEDELQSDEPDLGTGGTGTTPQTGVPNPGFTARGD